MAVIYSKLGGYLGDTTKLGPLAKTDLCAGVKGLLDRLMTYLGLGSSREDPRGSQLGGLGVRLLSQEPVLSAWEAVLFPWEAWRTLCLAECLGFCLPDLVPWLTAWLVGGCCLLGKSFPQQGYEWWPCCLLWWEHHHQGRGELPELLLNCFLPKREESTCLGGLGGLTACLRCH